SAVGAALGPVVALGVVTAGVVAGGSAGVGVVPVCVSDAAGAGAAVPASSSFCPRNTTNPIPTPTTIAIASTSLPRLGRTSATGPVARATTAVADEVLVGITGDDPVALGGGVKLPRGIAAGNRPGRVAPIAC